MRRILTVAATACICLSAAGCAGALVALPVIDTLVGVIGVGQSYDDRRAQRDQTKAIRELRDVQALTAAEIIKLREVIEERFHVLPQRAPAGTETAGLTQPPEPPRQVPSPDSPVPRPPEPLRVPLSEPPAVAP